MKKRRKAEVVLQTFFYFLALSTNGGKKESIWLRNLVFFELLFFVMVYGKRILTSNIIDLQVIKCVCYRVPLPDEEEDEDELEKEEEEKKKLSPNVTGSPNLMTTGSPNIVVGETNSRHSPSKESEVLSSSRRASRSLFHFIFYVIASYYLCSYSIQNRARRKFCCCELNPWSLMELWVLYFNNKTAAPRLCLLFKKVFEHRGYYYQLWMIVKKSL